MAESELAEQLKLDNQLCFPLYAASRLLTRLYQDKLEPLGITYPQYLVLMILWEQSPCPVKTIGERAILNTNTLTPLLKRLEQQGLVSRSRDARDERVVVVSLTAAGRELQQACSCVPQQMFEGLEVPLDKLWQLKQLLDELLPVLRQRVEG